MFSTRSFSFRAIVQSVFGIVLGFSSASVLANNTQQPLPFFQDWSNPSFGFGWGLVPGITGYSGDGLTGGFFVANPGNITANDAVSETSLTLSPFDQNDNSIYGVAQFGGSNPTIALRGSVDAEAPYLLVSLNTTSIDVADSAWISYVLRDMDATRNSVSPVALQYRVSNGGVFTNIPAAYVADATGNGATLVTPVRVQLPDAAKNQPLVQLRIITTNAVGEDEWVGVDDLLVGIPALSVSDSMVIEGNSDECITTPMNFTVSSNVRAPDGGILFDYYTQNGTAASNGAFPDFTGIPTGTPGVIPAGETSLQVTVSITCDDVLELSETFSLALSTDDDLVDDYILSAASNGTGTITPDEPIPVLSVADAEQFEGNATGSDACVHTVMNFTVSSDVVAPPGGITFDYYTAVASADAADYDDVPPFQSATILEGDQSTDVTIQLICDDDIEPNEIFEFHVPDPSPLYNVAVGTGIGTIVNDDEDIHITVDSVSVVEGHTGDKTLTFTVQLSEEAPAGGLFFTVDTDSPHTSDATPGVDYTPLQDLAVSIPEYSEEPAEVSVTIHGDTVPEGNEVFQFIITPITAIDEAASILTATGTIENDDVTQTLSITNVSVDEGDVGENPVATFTVSLAEPIPAVEYGNVSVEYATADDSAMLSNNDYANTSGMLTFIYGAGTSQEVTVPINGDIIFEPNETFFVNLSNATGTNVIVTDNQGTGSINNDDVTQILRITDVSVAEGADGENPVATFTISLDAPIPEDYGDVNVRYTTADNNPLSATSDSDYTSASGTLNFVENGAISQQFEVTITGDNTVELNETFVVNLSDATGTNVIVADGIGVGTITNDDIPAAPTVIINNINPDNQIYEGAGVLANFMVSLVLPDPPPPADTIYNVDVILEDGGSATEGAGGDFIYATETIELSAAQPLVPVYVEILDDADAAEGTEAFALGIDNATGGAEIGIPNIASVNILDDDSLLTPTFVINSDLPSVNENDGFANFTITLLAAGGNSYDVTVNSVDGIGAYGAQQGLDYTGVVNQTFTVSEAAPIQISVPIIDDPNDEAIAEYFTLQLSNPTGIAVIGTATANVDIIDNDEPVVDEVFADGFEVP